MKQSRFTDSQIIAILKQAQVGIPVPAVCREHGISSATFYKWRSRYAGKEPKRTNDIWSVDFMHDQMSDGKNYRLLNIIDDDKREGLAMEVGVSTPILSVTIGP